MVRRLRQFWLVILMSATLDAAGYTPALAQTPEAEQLAQAIAHEALSAIDMRAAVMNGAKTSVSDLGELSKFRPEWPKLVMEALQDEVATSGPAFERILARRFARVFTVEEMKAGQVILSDPIIKGMIAQAAEGRTVDQGNCGRDCMRAIVRPAGQSFMKKLSETDKFFGPDTQGDLVAAIIPGFLRRFAEKIEAAEKASPS